MNIFKGNIIAITRKGSLVVFDNDTEYEKSMKTDFRKDIAWLWGSPLFLKKHLDDEG